MQAFSFQVKLNFSPHATKLTGETSFAVLSDNHKKSNQLLQCLAEHICPQYTDILAQIQGDFSFKQISSFAASYYKKLGDKNSATKNLCSLTADNHSPTGMLNDNNQQQSTAAKLVSYRFRLKSENKLSHAH